MVTDAAYARCLHIARQHYENFPVASRLLSSDARPHVAAIYAFARIADDFADEGSRTPAARYALLDDWERRLTAGTPAKEAQSDADAIFTALGDTIRKFDLDLSLFTDLLSAFRQDVEKTRYETWDELFGYCRRSANPVGRLVLRISGYRDARLDAWSDAVCTALQLTNFWQDLAIDFDRGRLYVPLDVIRAAGADIEDLRRREWTPGWRAAMHEASERTRDCFARGRPIVDAVRGRLRWELRATWLGGMRILRQLERQDFNVLTRRPTLGIWDAISIGGRTVTWRRARS